MATTNSNNRTTAAADFYLTCLLNLHKIEVSFRSRRPPTVLVCLSQEGTPYREPLSLEDSRRVCPVPFGGVGRRCNAFAFRQQGSWLQEPKWTLASHTGKHGNGGMSEASRINENGRSRGWRRSRNHSWAGGCCCRHPGWHQGHRVGPELSLNLRSVLPESEASNWLSQAHAWPSC